MRARALRDADPAAIGVETTGEIVPGGGPGGAGGRPGDQATDQPPGTGRRRSRACGLRPVPGPSGCRPYLASPRWLGRDVTPTSQLTWSIGEGDLARSRRARPPRRAEQPTLRDSDEPATPVDRSRAADLARPRPSG